jgi:hypothetical protein
MPPEAAGFSPQRPRSIVGHDIAPSPSVNRSELLICGYASEIDVAMCPDRIVDSGRGVMTPEICEFSYGFALTNEIVGWAPITAAPLFPSLIEEGKAGGGYDVKLDMPVVPLYLQFKRADCMTRRSAREIRRDQLPLSLPFYRFKITESGKSDQHELVLALDDGTCLVFYAAPRFHCAARRDVLANIGLPPGAEAQHAQSPHGRQRSISDKGACAMHTLRATRDVRKVSLCLGHASLQSTEVYLRADPTEKLEALTAVTPLTLQRGRFRAPDMLIAMLNDVRSSNMLTERGRFIPSNARCAYPCSRLSATREPR